MPLSPRKRRLYLLERITDATYTELFLAWILLNITFAAIYFNISFTHPEHAPTALQGLEPLPRFLTSLYFSIITATSTGYGDIVPVGFSRALAATECISALLVFAVFVTKLVTRRQDIAMMDVHRLAFEGIFHNIRHGLFIVRKDIDLALERFEEHGELTHRDRENLHTACLQAEHLIGEIPTFYTARTHGLDVMNRNRESLLIEAVQRTTQRLNQLIETLKSDKARWPEKQHELDVLRAFTDSLGTAVTLWKEEGDGALKQYPDLAMQHQKIRSALGGTKSGAKKTAKR